MTLIVTCLDVQDGQFVLWQFTGVTKCVAETQARFTPSLAAEPVAAKFSLPTWATSSGSRASDQLDLQFIRSAGETKVLLIDSPDDEATLDFLGSKTELSVVCDSSNYSIWATSIQLPIKKTNAVLPPWQKASGFFVSRPFADGDVRLGSPRVFDLFVPLPKPIKIDFCGINSALQTVVVSGNVTNLLATGKFEVKRQVYMFFIEKDDLHHRLVTGVQRTGTVVLRKEQGDALQP